MSSGTGGAAVAEPAPHFVLVPMMARVLAGRGALVTFVTTPLNLLRLGRARRARATELGRKARAGGRGWWLVIPKRGASLVQHVEERKIMR
ncbi:hypothetical protein EJB05_09348, partial [Eragrostis curvula]